MDIAITTFDSLFVLYNLGGFNGGGPVTGVKESPGQKLPKEFSLSQNYPNPFNPTTTIRFEIRDAGFVTLKVYDMLGREAGTLVNEQLAPGAYTRSWNAGNLASGMYFCKLTAGTFTEVRKLLLMK